MVREDLQYDLCLGCGEISPRGQGLIAMISHSCDLNTFYYYTGTFGMRQLEALFGGVDPMKQFTDLLHFPYLSKMPEYATASDLDRKIYGHIRDMEVKQMKRLRAYIRLEEQLNSKY